MPSQESGIHQGVATARIVACQRCDGDAEME
jgi:hypothetical protein